ncbi:FAD-binding oxidoreductase [Gordonia zhaorongruii]|uniref:FAD-binding oxidoreductase n=1 Tax=Gordonia zhaorongruii TaxID=2597659 RepID=UPI00117EC94D|nr:FAD-binding oxidoreductase [Gordonia zhaorongruii]
MTQRETDVDVVDFTPGRWGNPNDQMQLSESVLKALTMLGIDEPAPNPAELTIPESRLDADALAALATTGARVETDDSVRSARLRGYSTPDLLKFRDGDGSDAPDAVVVANTAVEVAAVLAVCDERGIALSPFAGGTTVTGGLVPDRSRPVISLDLRQMTGLVDLDEVSQIATFAAGTRLPDAERYLAERGFELGHFPQSYEGATIGGCAVTRSAGQSSIGYGRFDDMVVGLTLATPGGVAEIGTAPKSAAGPDLRQLVLGSEGTFGVVTTVRVHVHPVPTARRFYGWHFPDFTSGAAAMRALAQSAVKPTVLRLSDEAETGLNLANPSAAGSTSDSAPTGGCLMVVGFEGDDADVECRDTYVTARLTDLGGTPLGTEPGEHWREGRFRGPYMRDPLLDAGALVETLETVTFWSNLEQLKADVTAAVTGALGEQGTPAVVMCHISHVYPTGASLYFTVISNALENPQEQWSKAKSAANAAIRDAGASITHHHAVGTDHQSTYLEEIGDVQVRALRAVKGALDPNGVLNPGILLP